MRPDLGVHGFWYGKIKLASPARLFVPPLDEQENQEKPEKQHAPRGAA
jgi:hypothetical protein